MTSTWEQVKLRDVCEIEKKKHSGEGLPYVGLEHVESGTGKFIGDHQAVQVKSSTFQFGADHLLYGRLRPYLNKVLLPDFEGHCSTEIFPIKVKSQLERKFLFYWFNCQHVIDAIDETSTGARMPRANVNAVLNFDFLLPPLVEQKRIVAILDEAFAGIDSAIANTQKNLANARELFESYLNTVFAQQGEGWTNRRLSEICENLDSKRIPIIKAKRLAGDIPYYGASGVVDHVADYIFDEELLLVSEDGANLLARTYPIAFSVSGKTWVNNHAHVLRFDNFNSQRFVEYYLNSISLEPYVSGMAQPKLNQKALNSILVPFPSPEIQKNIVEKLDDLSNSKDRLSRIHQQKLNALTELKQSLLQKAFFGELTAEATDKATDETVA